MILNKIIKFHKNYYNINNNLLIEKLKNLMNIIGLNLD